MSPTVKRVNETRPRAPARSRRTPGTSVEGRQRHHPPRPSRQHQARQAKSTGKIDGIIALMMALDRAIRDGSQPTGSVYDKRGLLVL
nr:MAG TPA: hypothetical protein [Caudoviricetes sp.]